MGRYEQLNTFVAVVEEGSFNGASRRFQMTSAAISKQIALLESELNCLLLERTTRKLSLTESGQLLFNHAKQLIDKGTEIEGLFSHMREEPFGHLRIASSWYFAEQMLLPHLHQFTRKYPKISIDLLNLERLPEFIKEGIDLNMGHTFVGGPDDVHRRLGETHYVYCASPSYLKKFGIPKIPKELSQHRYITHFWRVPDNVLEFDKGITVTLEPVLRCNDSRLMVRGAVEGLGIVKLHRYAVKKEIVEGQLVEILQGFDKTIQPIYLCYRPQKFLPPKIRHFIDFIVPKIKKELF